MYHKLLNLFKLLNKRRLSLFILLVLLGTLPFALKVSQEKQEIRQRAAETTINQTNSVQIAPGESLLKNSVSNTNPSIINAPSITTTYKNWQKIKILNTPTGRYRSALAFLPSIGKLILYGGWGGWDKGEYGDTWEFDGQNWKRLDDLVNLPGSKQGHTMVLDEANNRIVLFGGIHIDGVGQIWYTNDTYFLKYDNSWNKLMWEPASPQAKPSARVDHAMVYDPVRQRILMFGGTDQNRTFFNDTWEFDGKDWKQISTQTSPSGRIHPKMAYDIRRGKVVLHGGYNYTNNYLTDTWEYDSNNQTWKKIFDKGVDSNAGGDMAYDPSISKVVMFGGNSSGTWTSVMLDKTWEYDGTSWQGIPTAEHPLAVREPRMTYFPKLKKLILFGGAYWDNNLGDWTYQTDTWMYSTSQPTPTKLPTPTTDLYNINGYVFIDNDRNGYPTSGDQNYTLGSKVSLLNSSGLLIKTVVTNSSGYYSFGSLSKGTYNLVSNTPLGYIAISPGTRQISLAANTKIDFAIAPNGDGLLGYYFNNLDFTSLAFTRIDPIINFSWAYGTPDSRLSSDTFSVRWKGIIIPKYSQSYTFYALTDDGVRLWVNGVLIIDNWRTQVQTEKTGTITLTEGKRYDIRMDYFENLGGATAQLRWSSSSQVKEIIPKVRLFSK